MTRLLLAMVWLFLVIGCAEKPQAPAGLLTGRITLDGNPLTGGTVFARFGQEETSGFINPQGEYSLENPSVGELEFKIVVVPPPPPGTESTPGPVSVVIPREYQNYSKALTFKFAGGNQRFDISMQRRK